MGNASGREDGEGTSGETNFEEDYDGYVEEAMAHSPPHSPREFHPSLFFTSQNPRDPLSRPGEAIQTQAHALSQTAVYNGNADNEKLIRAIISWNHGGRQVAITGSWDNWESSEVMQSTGNEFIIVKLLPSGLYQYRFIVDGCLRCAGDLPWAYDNSGSAYNVLDLQESISDLPERLAKFEFPPSPPSSYDNRSLSEDDFRKPPPEVPPQLKDTFLNKPSSSNSGDQPLSMPHYSQLNHLHISNHIDSEFFALSSTHRFRQKIVTVVLYKPMRRGNQ